MEEQIKKITTKIEHGMMDAKEGTALIMALIKINNL